MQIYIKIEYDNGNRVEIVREDFEQAILTIRGQMEDVAAEEARAAQAEIDRKTAVKIEDAEEEVAQ